MKKEIVQRREEKCSCRVNCTVGLTDRKRLKGTLAATLYCSFNLLVLLESDPSLSGFL